MINKVKEWKSNAAFEILEYQTSGQIKSVVRLNDGKYFETHKMYVNQDNKDNFVFIFHNDCMNVDIKSYKYSGGANWFNGIFKTVHINDI